MAKIERVEDLPDWFGIDKYAGCGCADFNAIEWHGSLHARREVFSALNAAKQTGISKVSHIFQPDLEMLRRTPLNWRDGRGYIWFPGDVELEVRDSPVRDLSINHLISKIDQDRDSAETIGSRNLAGRWEPLLSSAPWDTWEGAEGAIGTIDEHGEPLLVDLSVSDSALTDAFSNWLNEKRATQENRPRRKKWLYEKWARYGLLQYLDLKIWEEETGNHIPDRVMAAAISRYDMGEENLRKTVAPLAKALMSSAAELRALASVEAASLRSK